MLNKFLNDNKEQLYAIFRIVVGLLFFLHGAQKFGIIGDGNPVGLFTLLGLAGIVELLGGLAIMLGFYTQTASILGSVVMIGALFLFNPSGEILAGHFSRGINPLANGGELPLLFLVSFFVLATQGPGIWSLDKKKNR